ncbi:MAG: phage integrase SAM-like domain-containing protein [Muribaculaceae bacterium]|nr:phage integrase SAM-like domain-containing protein [Muribaculaceae bacterium]
MKHSLRFFLNTSRHEGLSRVRCRVRWNGLQTIIDSGCHVEPDKWNADAQRCRRNSTHGSRHVAALVINRELDSIEAAVEAVFALDHPPKSVADFRQALDIATGKAAAPDTSADGYYARFLDNGIREGRWTKGTVTKLTTIRSRLREYKPGLLLSDIDEAFVSGFTEFQIRCGYSNPTIRKNWAVVKWFVRWCADNGFCQYPPCLNKRTAIRVARKEVIFLTWDELMTVYNAELPHPHLRRVRDVFCFQCFTSLRHSDVANLKKTAVFPDHISVVTIKTGDRLDIDLNKYSRAILDKYKDEKLPDGLALPVITTQKMNEYLKEVMRLCEIDTPITIVTYRGNQREEKVCPKWQLITSHAGRRTFVCNALMMGIPAEVVMKWTGHSSYASMRPYIAIADEAKRTEMAKFDSR